MHVILLMAMSADGYITKHQDGLVDWTSKEDKKHFVKITKDAGALIYGKRTFEFHNKALPGRLNVIMTRHPDVTKNQPGLLEFTNQSPAAILQDLEARGFKQVVLAGGSEINALFLQERLVNELYLTIEPRLFGSGKRLIKELNLDLQLELIESSLLNKNSVLLHYRVK